MKEIFNRLLFVFALIWSAAWIAYALWVEPPGVDRVAAFWMAALAYGPLWIKNTPYWLRAALCWAGTWGVSPWLFGAPVSVAWVFGVGGLAIAGASYYVFSPMFKK